MTPKEIAEELSKSEWNQSNFDRLVETCQASSAFQLRHPLLITLKWSSKEELNEIKGLLKEVTP